jgi:hypothetical protein
VSVMATDSLRLVIGATRISADLTRKGKLIWSGEAEYSGPEDLTDVIARLVVEPELAKPTSRVQVELEKPLVQCRTLTDLPPVKPAALRPMVEQQAHRYFRKNGHPLIVDAFRKNGRASVVLAAAVEEPVVAAIRAGIRAAGFRLDDVAPTGHRGALSLLLPEDRERQRRQARLYLQGLGIAVTALWFLVIGASVLNLMRQRRYVDREVALLAEPVAALSRVKQEVAIGRAMIDAVGKDGAARGSALRLLAAITDALPDSAFLTSLSIDGSRGYLGGYSRRASETLARLERSGAIIAPRLDGQLGREMFNGIEWERFSIAFGPEPEE